MPHFAIATIAKTLAKPLYFTQRGAKFFIHDTKKFNSKAIRDSQCAIDRYRFIVKRTKILTFKNHTQHLRLNTLALLRETVLMPISTIRAVGFSIPHHHLVLTAFLLSRFFLHFLTHNWEIFKILIATISTTYCLKTDVF